MASLDEGLSRRYPAIVTSMNLETVEERNPRPPDILHWCDDLAGGVSVVAGSDRMGKPRRKKPRIIKGKLCWKCSKCRRWKPEILFGIKRRNRNGLQHSCRECISVYDTKRYRQNRKREIDRVAKYRAENPEKVRRSCSRWYAKNPEKVRRLAKSWRLRNKDHRKAYKKKYDKRNPEKAKAQHAVAQEIKMGRLTRPDFCEVCGEQSKRIEAHHDSYAQDRRLVVTWLCSFCHAFFHARQAELLQGAR
jgi:hypothetical protein